MTTNHKSHFDIHEAVTQKIIKAIEDGAGDWQMPWHRPGISFDIPKNATTDARYRGINILSLWIDTDEKKFEHQIWATYKQWKDAGAQVRAGEKGSLIVKYGEWVPKQDAQGRQPTPAGENDDSDPKRVYAKPAWVFNIAQVDGFPAPQTHTPRVDLTQRIETVEAFVANTKADIRYGGQRAFYRQKNSAGDGDYVQMPDLTLFTGSATSTPTEARYATLLHELLHWTGAKDRLDRDHRSRFGDDAYAFEEILVELGSATLCCSLQITNEPRPDHAQYASHWLKVLKADNKAIFTAASAASRAVDYLYSLQGSASEGSS